MGSHGSNQIPRQKPDQGQGKVKARSRQSQGKVNARLRQGQGKVKARFRQGKGNVKASSRQGQGKFMARSRRGLGKVKARSRQGREASSTTVIALIRGAKSRYPGIQDTGHFWKEIRTFLNCCCKSQYILHKKASILWIYDKAQLQMIKQVFVQYPVHIMVQFRKYIFRTFFS